MVTNFLGAQVFKIETKHMWPKTSTHAWFLKIALVWEVDMCVYVCVHACVSTSKMINNERCDVAWYRSHVIG